MNVYESFQAFWDDHRAESPNRYGFFDWQPVALHHVSDLDYETNRLLARGSLGFQPLMVTQANPFTREHRTILVKHITDELFARYQAYCRSTYTRDFGHRHASFRPDATHAYTEYPDWQSFASVWLDRPERPVYAENLPLLIDHTPSLEYWTRKQMGDKVLPYQRLLVTTFHVPSRTFYDFFIKHIDDETAGRIKALLESRIYLHQDSLFQNQKVRQ